MKTDVKSFGKILSASLILLIGVGMGLWAQSDDDLFFTSSDDDWFQNSFDDDFLFGGSSFGSDDDFFGGDDMFFGGDDMFGEEITADTSDTSVTQSIFTGLDLINTEKVRFGGSASFGLSSGTSFANVFSSDATSWNYWEKGLSSFSLMPSMSAQFYFDVHMDDTLRFYGKGGINYPFETTTNVAVSLTENYSITTPNFKISELFTDFTLGDNVFFRFGKHGVKWGVGYFFSPADVINLGAINPEDPTADREGPVSLRAQMIFPGTQNYLYAYAVLSDDFSLKNTALAVKYETLVGNYELGFGAWYRNNRPPRVMTTITGSVGKVSVFAEGVAAWGTEEAWMDSASFSGKKPVFQATAGGSYTWSDPSITLFGQYYYNGFGRDSMKDLKISDVQDLLMKKLLYSYCGQHYLALSISKGKLFGSDDLSLSAFGLMSLTDCSGMASVTMSTKLFRNCNLSFGPSFTFGPEKSEYIFMTLSQEDMARALMTSEEKWRGNMGFSVSISFGGGKF